MGTPISIREADLQEKVDNLVFALGLMTGTVHKYCHDKVPTMEELVELCDRVIEISQNAMDMI